MEVGSPTTVMRSPYCSLKSCVASSLMSPRITRLTFTPYDLRNCRCPSRLPFSSGRVITITRLLTLASMAFQSTCPLFQSLSTCCPKRMTMAPTSSLWQTVNTLSPSSRTVSERGTITCLFRHRREMMNLRFVMREISPIVLPERAGLVTTNCPTYVLSSS